MKRRLRPIMSSLTWQYDNAHSPKQLHPAENLLAVFGGLEFAQIRKADSHRTGNSVVWMWDVYRNVLIAQ